MDQFSHELRKVGLHACIWCQFPVKHRTGLQVQFLQLQLQIQDASAELPENETEKFSDDLVDLWTRLGENLSLGFGFGFALIEKNGHHMEFFFMFFHVAPSPHAGSAFQCKAPTQR